MYKDGLFAYPSAGSARPPTIPTTWPTSKRMARAILTTITTLTPSAPIYPGRAPREARRKRETVPQARTVRARGKGICFPPGARTGLPGNGAGGGTDAGPGCGLNCARRPAFGRLGLPPPPPSQGGQGAVPLRLFAAAKSALLLLSQPNPLRWASVGCPGKICSHMSFMTDRMR